MNKNYFIVSLVFVWAAGCVSGDSLPAPSSNDTAPIKVVPDNDKLTGSNATAPGCNGVTAGGECRSGVAFYCDVAAGTTRQIDCAALGMPCVSEPAGVACLEVTDPGNPDNAGNTTEPCGGVVDFNGFCSSEGNAVWCDTTNDQIMNWDCAAEGRVCVENECATGAFCCLVQPPAENPCPALGFRGECTGDTARYCNGTNGENFVQIDCTAQNKVCAIDDCATGAYCCDPPAPAPAAM